MDIENLIDKIVDNGDLESMKNLSEILEDLMEVIEQYDENCYKKYEMVLYKMAYGNMLNREMAENIVSKMKPYAMRWSIDETKQIQQQFGISDIRPIDFFVVINSAYNDYKNIFNEDIESYVKFAMDFINDEDAKNDKVFLYYTSIPK